MGESGEHELHALLGRGLLEQVPFNVAVIDRNFRVVAANANFEDYFGDWRRRRCFEVYKNSAQPCPQCHVLETFRDGRVRVSDETGVDRHGRTCHYVVHLAPLRDASGEIRYVLEMTSDLTETRRWQREYDLFFERVPCYVLVVDRKYRVVRANEKFRESFGEPAGRFCYQICKRRREPCAHCPAQLTFEDGCEHTSRQEGVHRDGSPAHYVVTSSPLSRREGGISHVIEMATDVTQVHELEGELRKARDFYESLIRHSPLSILAVDGAGEVRIMNPAARRLLEWASAAPLPPAARLKQMLPAEFLTGDSPGGEQLDFMETEIRSAKGQGIPARFSAVNLISHGRRIGRAAYIEDLREIKRLAQEMLEAERLGAVGQTVAGLAHTIKNLLMGLEGGMYIVDGGLRRGDVARITKGWDILQRNFEKTTTLVKDFLSFAKGRLPELAPVDPKQLAVDVVELYRDAARLQGVELELDAEQDIQPAMLDRQGIETCLTNLISNAIDAAVMREEPGGKVLLHVSEAAGELVFAVTDNGCGMDWETKGKVFTTFFTTKGGQGTGLGLLTTRKIVQEHGGRIEVDTAPGKGATFRIRLRRDRLEAIAGSTRADTNSPER